SGHRAYGCKLSAVAFAREKERSGRRGRLDLFTRALFVQNARVRGDPFLNMSNFLGDVTGFSPRGSQIISGSEVIAREGVELHKGMNFRDRGGLLSVFLVLKREEGFTDEWNDDSEIYTFEGHDSTTVENGRSIDQIAMYPDGRLSDNGKFFKEA